ncbi:MAG: TonB family protein [Cyclobacteriaceae bacterium]
MSEDKKTYRYLSEQELKDYLAGKLAPAQQYDVERQSLDSDFDGEALEGWEHNDVDLLSDDLNLMRVRLSANTEKGSGTWMKVAAAVALLIAAGYGVWFAIDHAGSAESSLAVKHSEETPVLEDSSASAETDSADEKLAEVVVEEIADENTTTESKPSPIQEEEAEQPVVLTEEQKPQIAMADQGQKTLEPEVEEEVATNDETIALAEVPEVETISMDDVDEIVETNDLALETKPEVTNALQGKLAGVTTQNQNSADQTGAVSRASSVPPASKSRMLRGVVTGKEDQTPIPGVTVTVKGTSKGAVTNMDGEYLIEVPAGGETLLFSFIGYKPEEQVISDQAVIDVELGADLVALEEVVVTGYGEQKKENVTGAVTTIEVDEFEIEYREAQPVEGDKAYKTYIELSMTYPPAARENNIKGTVRLQISVSKAGEITSVEVKSGLGYGCDEEAVRLVEQGPRWQPAIRNDQPIDSRVTYRIKFPQ